jgi:ActR/RegA family two-component response regulator
MRKKSLLIVEDNAPVLEALADLAGRMGFDVVTASSLANATKAIERRRFDAALIDKRLVENDTRNEDGLIILGQLKSRNEGTVPFLLSGHGDYHDAAVAQQQYGATVLEKTASAAIWAGPVEFALQQELDKNVSSRKARGARAFCGNDRPDEWDISLSMALGKSDMSSLNHLLDEMALTCDPLRERGKDNGLTKVADHVFAGPYWSRGIGEAVIVAIGTDPLPDPLPVFPDWPAVDRRLYHRSSNKPNHLVGAIYVCSGAQPTDFTVPRSPWE